MAQATDKRVVRSRRLIRQAFETLLTQKDFDAITVTDIIQQADLNRGTFYAHYRDVRDVRDQLEAELMNQIRTILQDNQAAFDAGDLHPLLIQVTSYAEENISFIRTMFRASGSQRLLDGILQLIQEHPLPTQPLAPEIEPLIQRYVACGIMGLAELWIQGDHPLSAPHVVSLIEALVSSIKALIASLEHVTL